MPLPFPGIPRKAVDRPPLFCYNISKKSACKDFFAPDFNNTGRCARGVQKEYLDFILKQLSGLEGVSYRPMMGEYILYFRKK